MKKTLTIGVLLTAAAVLAGCSSSSMSHTPAIDSEETFIINMIPHHQEAIASADLVWAKSTNPDIRKLAEDIVNAQEKEVIQMQQWMSEWYPASTGEAMYMEMMPDLNGLESPELDKAFLEGMIDHHEGAIAMAKRVLRVKPREEVTTLANNIISTQNDEISTMKKMLNDMK